MTQPAKAPAEELEQKSTDLVVRAGDALVIDQASYEMAVEIGRGIRLLRDQAEAHHRPVIDAAHKAHKAALAALKRIDDPLKTAQELLDGKIHVFVVAKEREQREAERLAREAEERLRLEVFEREIEALEANGAPPEEIQAAIVEAEAAPMAAPAVSVAPTYTKAQGAAVRKNYKAEVYDLPALIRWVAQRPEQVGLLTPNYVLLNALVRNMGTQCKIDGVRAVEVRSVAITR